MQGLVIQDASTTFFQNGSQPSGVLSSELELDEKDAVEMESYIAGAIVRGILATGDGSADAPWQVTRTSDEYDVLQFQEKEFAGQSLIETGERKLDAMKCTDGSVLHFDITDAQARLKQAFGE